VDGLRAVAVLLVVFDHLRTRILGGYIGVDVFFVISGYLISSVILADMDAGRFSIVSFYERRIRRIFPALLVMLAGTAALAWVCFAPSEVEEYNRTMLAALLSVSNFLFWHQAGYFDAPSALKPLLHTWSLAVEEQFYIIFPLFLVIVRRWLPGRLRAAIWTVTGITFVLACVEVTRDPTAAFFFAPLRAWELLIGTILSQRYLPAIEGRAARELAGVGGLLLILVPAVRYTAATHFPGLAALPPCVGAALIIAAGETGGSLVGSVLGWRPVVFVGLISYSLYLWHWPILVFQNTSYLFVSAFPESKIAKVVVFSVSMVAATLSWAVVERPFRKGRFRPGRRALFVVNGAAVAGLAAFALIVAGAHGFPSRFPPDALVMDAYSSYDPAVPYRQNVCFIGAPGTFADFDKARCLADDPTRNHYLLLGDSHAASLYPGLEKVFPELNLSQANTASCRPLLEAINWGDNYCSQMWRFIYTDYLPHHRVDAVVIAGRWSETDFEELGRTIAFVQQMGIPVTLVGPFVEFDQPLPRLLTAALRDHNPSQVERYLSDWPRQVDRKLAPLARNVWKVRYISVLDDLCNSQVEMVAKAQPETSASCPLYAAPGVPLLFDTDHFTAAGSVLLAEAIRARNQLP
jgi:peptidoglycan/LPS O-acetylase OafA/YrhL